MTENTDITNNTAASLLNDFTQMIRLEIGSDRDERRREKIRRELIENYFPDPQAKPPSLNARLRKLFTSA